MENNKEFAFKGRTLNGFAVLALNIALTLLGAASLIYGVEQISYGCIATGTVLLLASLVAWCGFIQLEPNEARVMMFFGCYRGTFTRVGFFWVHPFISTKRLSLRARNLDAEPIKVNDKTGNPVMIGLVLVWKLKDTYKAMFEIDSQTMAQSAGAAAAATGASGIMKALEKFVKTQSDAALRQVAGQYAYDDTDNSRPELTLRSGGEEINGQLEAKLDERLSMAGIEIVEARINYLAYAPEIAAVMLRRQQAAAIITAREKIVEGAVSMVKMALERLDSEGIVKLDEEKKAAMVGNLMVVLCSDESAQPVVNAGACDL